MIYSIERENFIASDDPELVDRGIVHDFLRRSYWAQNIPRETVERSLDNAIVLGLYERNGGDLRMIGMARAISDYATFAYLCDVFVLEEWQRRGLGQWLVKGLLDHPRLQGLRRWMLATHDAHGVYAKLGFKPVADPSTLMTIHDPGIYKR